MSKLTAQIESTIEVLTEMREDAEKCDKGKTGAPGTRLRKAATDVAGRMKIMRADVLAARKAEK